MRFNMAAYGNDDFVTGSDFSDLSDLSDQELDAKDVSEPDYESDDDGRQYCICREPSTMEMIACDNDQCAVIWWHYGCAGVTADAIPDTWICNQCIPGSSAEEIGKLVVKWKNGRVKKNKRMILEIFLTIPLGEVLFILLLV